MWVSLNQAEDEYELLCWVDVYADYALGIMSPENFRIFNESQGAQDSTSPINVKMVNLDAEKRTKQAESGEKPVLHDNKDIAEKMKIVRTRLVKKIGEKLEEFGPAGDDNG